MNKIVSLSIALLLCGCVQKMAEKGSVRPYDLLPRAQPAGTIAKDEAFSRASAVRFTYEALERGRERFDIYCSACHGLSGYGDGMIVKRGFLAPPSYHQERLRRAPDSHFFDVMTHGYGAMYSYSDKLSIDDRWAIVAYIRALQLSQNAPVRELPREIIERLSSEPSP